MGLLDRLFGERRTQVISADDRLSALLGKLEISPDTAGEIPAVSACTDFISSCIAGLTVRLYREKHGENTTEEIRNDNRLRLLNDETGDLLDPYQMKQAVITDFFLYGGGFIYPEMNGNEVLSLRYIRHGSISAYMGSDPVFKYGEYVLSNGMRLRDDEVIRLLRDTKDGMTGESVILQHQQLLTAAYREIVYEKLLVSSGGNKKGFLTSENKLDKDKLAELRQAWNDMYANSGNTMMVLNKGLQFHESSNTSVEMQLNQNQAKNNELICQLFGLSPEAVCGKASDEVIVSAIKGAVIPVVTAFEAALNRGLLLPSERDDMYFAFDTSELLKGDILKRYQAYKTGLESNVLQIDEVRYKEDLPPLGINFIKLGLQDVLYDPKTKTIYTPNMNQSMTMSENKVNFGNDEVDNSGQGGIMEERFRKDQDRDEHGRFASEDGSSSDSSDSEKNRKELCEAIKSGRVKTKLDKSKQSKHKYGSKEYNKAIEDGDLPSYTELSHMEIQKIINEHSTKGNVNFDNGQFREVITLKSNFGYYGDRRTGKYIPTNRGTIHYSKSGTHLVPAPPKEE